MIAVVITLVTYSVVLAEKAVDSFLHSDKTYQSVTVTKVITADSFLLDSGEKIKMIGLKAPEKPPKKKIEFDKYGFPIKYEDPRTTLGERAYGFTKEALEGRQVRLEFDYEKKSSDFETLAYVFLPDQTFVNAEVLRQGYADLKIVPPNKKYLDILQKAYQEARREKRGIHGE